MTQTHRQLALVFFLATAGPATAATLPGDSPRELDEPVINPELDRRDVSIPRIDSENFEAGVFTGLYSTEDFGARFVVGATAGFHISEDIFVEASAGITPVKDTSFRRIGLPVFPEEDETLTYYDISVAYNVLPGELFFAHRTAVTTQLYLIAGAGTTTFIDEDRFTFNYGVGFRLLHNDWMAWRIDMRNHVFDMDILGQNKATNNMEFRGGVSLFF